MTNSIEEQIKELSIKEDFKGLIAKVILAETFRLREVYNPEISVQKFVQEDKSDGRVWVQVILRIEQNEISLYPCRPFMDSGVTLTHSGSSVFFRKNYYLYED